MDETSTEQGQVKVLDPAGKPVMDKGESKVKSFTFRETVLEKPDPQKRPTKLSRQYTKAEVKIDGKPQVLPYQGQTVLIEASYLRKKGQEGLSLDTQQVNKGYYQSQTRMELVSPPYLPSEGP